MSTTLKEHTRTHMGENRINAMCVKSSLVVAPT